MEWVFIGILSGFVLITLGIVVYLLFAIKNGKFGHPSPLNFDWNPQIQALSEAVKTLQSSLPLQLQTMQAENKAEIEKALRLQSESHSAKLVGFENEIRALFTESTQKETERLLQFQTSILTNVQTAIEGIRKKVDENLVALQGQVSTSLQTGFQGTSESMERLQKALGEIETAQKSIESLSGEVLSLKNVLTNSQQRGRYGEMQLEMIVETMFGESYRGQLYDFQYVVKGDETTYRPDCVVFLDGETRKQIMAIDAKFSLVGYEGLFDGTPKEAEEKAELRKAFKKALETNLASLASYAASGKFVRPTILFIPNDGVFAYVENEFFDLVEEAHRKNVIFASPTILQPIIASFKAVQLDAKRTKNLERITKALDELGREFNRFMERWGKIERSVSTLSKATDDFGITVKKMDKKFLSISSSDTKEIPVIEEENEEALL
ncbi:MAG: DNA recombination protein RmuC [Candidatus Enteromonas sp.]|nr:DNA recombination protein RmuC [Candidatus Enteromonas sp.]